MAVGTVQLVLQRSRRIGLDWQAKGVASLPGLLLAGSLGSLLVTCLAAPPWTRLVGEDPE